MSLSTIKVVTLRLCETSICIGTEHIPSSRHRLYRFDCIYVLMLRFHEEIPWLEISICVWTKRIGAVVYKEGRFSVEEELARTIHGSRWINLC